LSNALVVCAILLFAGIGRRIEYADRNFSFPWFHDWITWHWGFYQTRMLMLAAIGVIMAVSLQLINGIAGQFSLGHAGFMAVGAYLSGYASSTYALLDPDDPGTNYENVGQVAWYFVSLATVVFTIAVVLTVVFLLLRLSQRLWRGLPPLLLLAVLAWFTWDFSAGFGLDSVPPYLIWTKLLRGLGEMFAWTLAQGLGHALEFSKWLPAWSRRPLCFLTLLTGGGLFASAAGLLVGLPTLRLRGDYLAIATLGFAEIIRVVITNSQALGRSTGLPVTPYANRPDAIPDPDRPGDPVTHFIFPWILAMMVVTIVAVWRIAYSPKGRLIRAVREDEVAAAAVGISTTRQKVTAFIVGAFFAGVGGVLYVHREGYVNPSSFGIDQSLLYVVMVTLGGLGSITGAIVAGALLTLLPFLFRQLASVQALPLSVRHVFENQFAVLALALVIMMLVRPRGLLGGRELWWRRNRRALQTAPAAGATAV
jgi:branched-chain amino acid transport system permease protein